MGEGVGVGDAGCFEEVGIDAAVVGGGGGLGDPKGAADDGDRDVGEGVAAGGGLGGGELGEGEEEE